MGDTKLSAPRKALALKVLQARRKKWAEVQAAYDAECQSYREDGYAPHYCIHGRNLWVDYDIACGACENGEQYWDYVGEAHYVLSAVRVADRAVTQRMNIVKDAYAASGHELDFPLPAMTAWAIAPIKELEAECA